MRGDGRRYDELRPVIITPGIAKYAEGSALITMGETQVRCTASVGAAFSAQHREGLGDG
jgi:ribonuclease PH